MAKRPKPVHQLTNAEFEAMFPDEDACCAYLVARRWPEGVRCPRCGAEKPHKLSNRPWSWQCYQCAPDTSYRFSHIAGTIFENTNKPLRDWFKVAHLMLTSKKGMSALQIMRYMGFGSYKTAWGMCHKIRVALMEDIEKLGGIVEVDETYVGGSDKNRHWDKKSHTRGRGYDPRKTAVVGAVKRKGNVVARVVMGTDETTVTDVRQFRPKSACFARTTIPPIARSERSSRTPLSATALDATLSARFTPTQSRASGRF
jgi:hypothetical protein